MFSTIYFKAQCFGGLIVFLCMYLWIFNILFFVFKSTDQGTSIVGWSLDSPLFSLVSLAAIVCMYVNMKPCHFVSCPFLNEAQFFFLSSSYWGCTASECRRLLVSLRSPTAVLAFPRKCTMSFRKHCQKLISVPIFMCTELQAYGVR